MILKGVASVNIYMYIMRESIAHEWLEKIQSWNVSGEYKFFENGCQL